MRLSLAWLVPVLIASAFIAGRMAGPDPASASASARVYTGRRRIPRPVSSHALSGYWRGWFPSALLQSHRRWAIYGGLLQIEHPRLA